MQIFGYKNGEKNYVISSQQRRQHSDALTQENVHESDI